jgi:hypothetical protein
MAMKTIKYNIAKAVLVFSLGLIALITKAQDDRSERLQESISSSDQRTDFSARKAAPSKIDSFAFKELLKAREKCKEAEQRVATLQEKYRQEKSKATLSSTDASRLKKAGAELDEARAALKTAKGAVKAAERKANAD